MLQGSKLGPYVATRLPKPSDVSSTHLPSAAIAPSQPNKKTLNSRLTQEITFKPIADELAAGHNLLWVPSGRVRDCPCTGYGPSRGKAEVLYCIYSMMRCGSLKMDRPLEMCGSLLSRKRHC